MRVVLKLTACSKLFSNLRSASGLSTHRPRALPLRLIPLRRTRLPSTLPWRQPFATTAMTPEKRNTEMPEAVSPDFDKSQFLHTIRIKALRIPAKQTSQYLKVLNK